jgi:hypothetical protein
MTVTVHKEYHPIARGVNWIIFSALQETESDRIKDFVNFFRRKTHVHYDDVVMIAMDYYKENINSQKVRIDAKKNQIGVYTNSEFPRFIVSKVYM